MAKKEDRELREDPNGRYEGECLGCDLLLPINDLGLCEDCFAKLERDLIRQREWEYSMTAFVVPDEKLEDLRKQVIDTHGGAFELIAPASKNLLKKSARKKKQQD